MEEADSKLRDSKAFDRAALVIIEVLQVSSAGDFE
jgi:hypothetical protein